MKNETLEIILTKLIEENKKSAQNIDLMQAGIESLAERMDELLNKLDANFSKGHEDEQTKEEVKGEIRKGFELMAEEIRKGINDLPREVIHEKRILFYPEGDRDNFLKFIIVRLLLIFSLGLILYFVIPELGSYLKSNYKYKVIYDYTYHTNKDAADYLEKLRGFYEYNDSTKRILINELSK